MASTSSPIRSTKTYLWYLSDVLGTGATSTVYRGRHKKTGELVAAKAFNNMSYMRPQSVQQREFDVLLKLHHPNIVKLFDIEQDQITKNPVIIMELCSGGSVYNILEDPKNSYGLEEEELKRVLGDVCAGMKHLRDLDIVHRDIKPGNIMIVKADDGSSIYKLADFGAARELQDDENFVSLYGTEEYLHPDLYERAVLRQRTDKTFSARIDLWSIGVTFYHVATGLLPFRPFGGRRNRETMFHITTQKASGVISGVQKDSMNGPIEWSSELPNTCHLSSGLRTLFTKILRGLLECTPERMWTFSKFFDEVQHLLAMRVVDVFFVAKSECLKVYVEPRGTLAEFQESIAEQTGVQASTQALVWERDCFYPDASLKCESYPKTTQQNPIILLQKDLQDFPRVPVPIQPKLPKMTSTYDLEKDASVAKKCVAVMYFTLAWLQNITCMQELMTSVSKAIVNVLKVEIKQLDYHCVKLKSEMIEANTRLYAIRQSLPLPPVSSAIFRRMPLASMLCSRLVDTQQQIDKTHMKANEMADTYTNATRRLKHLYKLLIDDDQLTLKWRPTEQALMPCYKCVRRFEHYTEETRKIYLQFKKDKQKKQLSYNEEQIHKMDKEKLNMNSNTAISMCQSHCEERWKKIHNKLSEWYSIAHQYRDQIDQVDRTLSSLVLEYQTLLHEVHMLDQNVQPIVMEFNETLQDCLTDNSPIRMMPIQRQQPKADVATNTDLLFVGNGLDDGMPKLADVDVTPNDIASISEQFEHLPIDSNGCILVPRNIKAIFDSWERNVDMVTGQMELGKQHLEKMRQMSMPKEDSSLFSMQLQPLESGDDQYLSDTTLSDKGAGQYFIKGPPVEGAMDITSYIVKSSPVTDDRRAWPRDSPQEGALISPLQTRSPQGVPMGGRTRSDFAQSKEKQDLTQFTVNAPWMGSDTAWPTK